MHYLISPPDPQTYIPISFSQLNYPFNRCFRWFKQFLVLTTHLTLSSEWFWRISIHFSTPSLLFSFLTIVKSFVLYHLDQERRSSRLGLKRHQNFKFKLSYGKNSPNNLYFQRVCLQINASPQSLPFRDSNYINFSLKKSQTFF